jgi:hypothetical protein
MAVTTQDIQNWLAQNPGASDATIAAAMNQYGVTPQQMSEATGVPLEQVQSRYDAVMQPAPQPMSPAPTTPPPPQKPNITTQDIQNWFAQNPGASDVTIANAMKQYGVTPQQMSQATGVPVDQVISRYNTALGIKPTTTTPVTTSTGTPPGTTFTTPTSSGLNPQSETTQTKGVASWAQPYLGSMLGATQAQLFNYDAAGNPTGLKGYTPYSYDPAQYFAAFSPLQQQAQYGAQNLQSPWQTGLASGYLSNLLSQAANQQYNPTYFGYNQASAPNLQQYQMQGPQNVTAPTAQAAQLGAAPTAQAAQMQGPNAVGYQNVQANAVGTPTMQAAQTGYNPNLQTYQMGPAERVGTGSFMDQSQAYMNPYIEQVLKPQLAEATRQSQIQDLQNKAAATKAGAYGGGRQAIMEAENQRALQQNLANITGQGYNQAYQQAMQQYSTDAARQLAAQQANQQAGLTAGQQNLAAQLGVQQLGTQTGLQTALSNLNNQQQAAVQNQAAQLQSQGLNAQQALQAALANQQAGMQTGQFNAQQAYNTALQNAQMQQQANLANQGLLGQYGLQQGQFGQAANLANAQQGLQAALANQQAGLTTGQQNLAALLGVQQLGSGQNIQAQLANQQAAQQANALNAQQQQFGANLGLQGLQAAMGGAGQLGGLGTSALQNQLNILNAQNIFGGQQQQQQQNIINQAVQNYNTAQQYPYQQLGFMQNMLQGLPYETQTTQVSQAPPTLAQNLGALGMGLYGLNQLTGGGSGGTGGGITGLLNSAGNWVSNLFNPTTGDTSLAGGLGVADTSNTTLGAILPSVAQSGYMAKGGQVKGYAYGGSVDSSGNIEEIVSNLTDAQLQQAYKMAVSRGDIEQAKIVRDEITSRASERGGLAGAFNQLPAPTRENIVRGAKGGIVAFAGEDDSLVQLSPEFGGQNVETVIDPFAAKAKAEEELKIARENNDPDAVRKAMDKLLNASREIRQSGREPDTTAVKPVDFPYNPVDEAAGAWDDSGVTAPTVSKPPAASQVPPSAPQKAGIGGIPSYLTDYLAQSKRQQQQLESLGKPINYGDENADIARIAAEREARIGANPAFALMEQLKAQREANRLTNLEQGKGLAALAAMKGMLAPGGFMRGLGEAGSIVADKMEKVFAKDQAAKDAMMEADLKLAEAKYQQKVGNDDKAVQARKDAMALQRDARKAEFDSVKAQADITEKDMTVINHAMQTQAMAQHYAQAGITDIQKIADDIQKHNPSLSRDDALDQAARLKNMGSLARTDVAGQNAADKDFENWKKGFEGVMAMIKANDKNPAISAQGKAEIEAARRQAYARRGLDLPSTSGGSGSPGWGDLRKNP